jgi:Fe-S-cluster-containing hydrogenase component 2
MGIDVMSKKSVDDGDCISCLNCTVCPVDAVNVKHKKVKLSGKKFAGLSLALALIVFRGFYFTGNFSTSKTAEQALNQGGKVDAANIKGYMTLEEIAQATKLETSKLY